MRHKGAERRQLMNADRMLEAAIAMDPRNYDRIPEAITEGLKNYASLGVPCGDFIQAVIANDLLDAVGRADVGCMRALPAIACFVYQELPSICHGSRKVYAAWLAFHRGKLNGVDAEKLQELADVVSEARDEATKWRGRP